jgi:small subunit ribosomal protein S2
MRQLLEAGVHFGHNTRRWNPKMAPYLFGARNGIHIINLQQTVPMLYRAMTAVRDIVAGGGRVLFVGTKRQAGEKIAEAAKRCGQYYVNHRWLGGMMTNWRTISKSIKSLRDLDEKLAEASAGSTKIGLTKKELLRLSRERDKLERALGGIREMGDLPDVLFVIDTNKESIAVAEANKMGIPVVGVIDSNSDPNGIDYPIPGNDDAMRAIVLYCDLLVGSVLEGIQKEVSASGEDLGEAEEPIPETLPEQATAEIDSGKAEEPAPETLPEQATAEIDSGKAEEPAPEALPEQAAAESDSGKAEEPAPEALPEKAAAESDSGKAEEPIPEALPEKAAAESDLSKAGEPEPPVAGAEAKNGAEPIAEEAPQSEKPVPAEDEKDRPEAAAETPAASQEENKS